MLNVIIYARVRSGAAALPGPTWPGTSSLAGRPSPGAPTAGGLPHVAMRWDGLHRDRTGGHRRSGGATPTAVASTGRSPCVWGAMSLTSWKLPLQTFTAVATS